jgi:hypothetical protein
MASTISIHVMSQTQNEFSKNFTSLSLCNKNLLFFDHSYYLQILVNQPEILIHQNIFEHLVVLLLKLAHVQHIYLVAY